MEYKKIIGYMNGENEIDSSIVRLAKEYSNTGADSLFIYNYTKDDASRDEFLKTMKIVAKECEIPFSIGIFVERFEDIKKALYTGAQRVVVKQALLKGDTALIEGVERFGKDKIIMEIDSIGDFKDYAYTQHLKKIGVCGVMLKHVVISDRLKKNIIKADMPIMIRDSLTRNDLMELMNIEKVEGVATNYFEGKDIMKAKRALYENKVPVNIFETSMKFSDFKKNADGLIPVITQDYKTSEVLMLAYMNEESFEKTLETGKMTYWSRSRNELWCKGDTSGHVQYVKHLMIDCDSDTILAKVKQVGAACHTGNRTCFFTDLVKHEYDEVNPLTVFNDVYDVILDRKMHPKEGSYTNYLFDKGIDKILKKCGEEATEIVIAAKNPDAEELKYEIADFMYHMMVLMAECGLDWDDVIKELAHRR
ncbi:MAG: bifunctional phosphoribosyl-AMP cyclohydrolase/phosphoribosyl-ATP diphosphatase HisIE [Velocimicrobium sp.]